MRVDQVLCAAGPVDAVTNQALAYRGLFDRWGWTGEDFAPVQAYGMPRGAVRPLHELGSRRDDPLVLHYSGYARGLERALAGRRRTLLVFHNITPARYFWEIDPAEAVRCELARAQLGELAGTAALLAGVSEFNARELSELAGREAAVIPVVFDTRTMPVPNGSVGAVAPPGGSRTVLFVGRLVPHKRQDLVIRAFARYRGREPTAALILVGTPLSPEYEAALAGLAANVVPGGVRFESDLSPTELWARYRGAAAFLCLSEHEGFCIPLLEAFHFGVPVIARAAGAVGEVVGDAGLLVGEDDTLATVAELLGIVTTDAELRDELARRGRRRLQEYDYDRTAVRLREALGTLAAG
jgi:L-malate glycosyltransferase